MSKIQGLLENIESQKRRIAAMEALIKDGVRFTSHVYTLRVSRFHSEEAMEMVYAGIRMEIETLYGELGKMEAKVAAIEELLA